jgi:hypothetical protein
MYRRQFPQLAAAEAEAANSNTANALNQLQNLSRR